MIPELTTEQKHHFMVAYLKIFGIDGDWSDYDQIKRWYFEMFDFPSCFQKNINHKTNKRPLSRYYRDTVVNGKKALELASDICSTSNLDRAYRDYQEKHAAIPIRYATSINAITGEESIVGVIIEG